MTNYIRIAEPSDIVEAIEYLIEEALDKSESEIAGKLESEIETLQERVWQLSNDNSELSEQIENLKDLLKGNGIEY